LNKSSSFCLRSKTAGHGLIPTANLVFESLIPQAFLRFKSHILHWDWSSRSHLSIRTSFISFGLHLPSQSSH